MKPKILAVDDKPQNLFALEQLLRNLPVELIKTPSPIEALELALDHDFCVAIVDVQMPEMDGYELVRLLRGYECTACLPVIFVSAIYSDEYHHQRGYEAGAVDFLSKPFVPQILLSKVKVFIDLYKQRWEMENLIDQLNTANQRLSVLNTEKDRLIGIAAHDLRNPLGNILGLSELLLVPELEFSPDEENELITDIYKQSEYMVTLIEDLLDVSQIESGVLELRKEEVNVADYLVDLINHHHQIATNTKGSSVSLDLVPPVEVNLDPVRMRQVVDNLVSNAVKYSPPGSRTIVDVESTKSGLRFNIRDEGQGIPIQEQAKLFDYFCKVSTTPTGDEKSTGLGLAISARIIKAHGGEIGVDSTPGNGSTFWFTIPCEHEAALVI